MALFASAITSSSLYRIITRFVQWMRLCCSGNEPSITCLGEPRSPWRAASKSSAVKSKFAKQLNQVEFLVRNDKVYGIGSERQSVQVPLEGSTIAR
jgi:hypothetical protein